jgi:hypothetical protein
MAMTMLAKAMSSCLADSYPRGAMICQKGWRIRIVEPDKFGREAIETSKKNRPQQVATRLKAAREKTTFRQRQVTRIVNGINASKATGTIEFLLADDLVRFHLTGTSDSTTQAKKVAEKVIGLGKVSAAEIGGFAKQHAKFQAREIPPAENTPFSAVDVGKPHAVQTDRFI